MRNFDYLINYLQIIVNNKLLLMDKIAILIPAYNESITIAKVVHDFKMALPEATIYVYDNNSSDNTSEIATAAGAIVRKEMKQGKGNVIRKMFREIDAECYIMVDGDDTYPAVHAKEMANLVLQDKNDMVIGDRLSSTYFEENKRPFHNFGNSLVRNMINFLFGSDIKDIMTGYRAFSFSFVKSIPVLSRGFEIETEMTVHALDKNMHIANVVITYQDRPPGSESKLSTYSDGFKVIKTILRLFKNYKPFEFFSLTALFIFLISVGLFIPVLITYLETHLVPRFPTLIVSGILLLISVLLLLLGILLDVIKHKNKHDFEMRLHVVHHQLQDLKKASND